MKRRAMDWLGRAIAAIATVGLLAACAGEAPVAPERSATSSLALAGSAATDLQSDGRAVDLGSCTNLVPRTPSRLAARLYASGAQIYRWNGTKWSFIAPSAELFADAEGKGLVGTHGAGPNWLTVSGSKVYGAVIDRCTPNAGAIAWLLLGVTSNEGHGLFHDVNFIQRLNTIGGLEPVDPGLVVGEEQSVPYTAEYLFYRPE